MQSTDNRLIIFYDGECALCNRAVRFLLRQKKFLFAPLQGTTAKKLLNPPITPDTLILFERGKEHRFGKGALRIAWHLGGPWRLLGLLSFLPVPLVDPLYRLVARNRHLFTRKSAPPPTTTDRFLP